MKKNNWLILFAFLIPYLLIYQAFFSHKPLAFGDSPFYFKENLQELFNEPFLWNFRNDNFGASQGHILWLYLVNFSSGLLNRLFGLDFEIISRLVFYFPATILAIIGSWKLLNRFVQDREAKIIGSFLYGFNSYFLLLIDGGQVGVALAYGLFPLTTKLLIDFTEKTNLKNFILSIFGLFLIINSDLRIAILSVFFVIILWLLNLRSYPLTKLRIALSGLLFLSLVGLNAFFLIPLILESGISTLTGNLLNTPSFISLQNSFFLFQPNFPLNEFGRIFNTPFYYVFLPILLFGTFLIGARGLSIGKKVYALSLMFLLFAFLAKGNAEPLGIIYDKFINLTPFGVAFRDSSKFYIPLLLSASILIGFSVTHLKSVIKNRGFFTATIAGIYLYLSLLIYPAFLGQMTGILASGQPNQDFPVIYQKLISEPGFMRTVWFPETPPRAFRDKDRQSINANQLFSEKPFASMIMGEYDLFYFLHDSSLTDWFKLLGIKYAFFPENERKKIWTDKEKQERKEFLEFVDQIPGFQKTDWPISFPAYKVADPLPKIFLQKKVYVVLGGTEIYRQLSQIIPNFSLANQGFIFLKDGQWDPNRLLELPKGAVSLIGTKTDSENLVFSFLRDKFIPLNNIEENNWGVYKSSQFLNWRYELLKHGIKTDELDYNQDVFFSSVPGEKIKFIINVPKKNSSYYLGFRNIATDSGKLSIQFLDQTQEIEASPSTKFKWNILGPFEVDKNNNLEISFENVKGFNVLNSIALVSKKDFYDINSKLLEIFKRFEAYDLEDPKYQNLIKEDQLKNSPQVVSYLEKSPVEYEIQNSGKGWLVFSDHYSQGWEVSDKGTRPYPLYSMINGFYIEKEDTGNILLKYEPQKLISLGMKISLITLSLLIVGTVITWIKASNESKNKNNP